MLDIYIDNANLVLKRLTLQRELQEVRQQRQAANKQHGRLVRYHEHFAGNAKTDLHVLLDRKMYLKEYNAAVESMYDSLPPQYVVRQHAELVKLVRSQEILQTYIRLVKKQNNEMIEDLMYTKQEMQTHLRFQNAQRKHCTKLIQEQLYEQLLQTVQSCHRNTNEINRRSILQSLIRRKASNHVLNEQYKSSKMGAF